jgi:hypothetical protein
MWVMRLTRLPVSRSHQVTQRRIGGEIVGHADGVDARLQGRFVGDAVDAAAVDVDHRVEVAQGVAVGGE